MGEGMELRKFVAQEYIFGVRARHLVCRSAKNMVTNQRKANKRDIEVIYEQPL